MAREMPTNNAPDPISQARAAARIAPRAVTPRTTQIGMDALSGNANSSFPNVLSDALQGLDPSLSGTADGFGTPGQPSATNPLAALANMAGLSGLQGLGAGASALGLSGIPGLGGLAGMTGATQAPASPAGQTAVDTALGYLGRHDWNNYCERFVEVCYGTQNLYPNAASAGRALVTHRGTSALATAPAGAILYFAANAGNQQQGHAALYVGDGRMVSATPNGVKIERVDSPAYEGQFLGWAEPGSFGQGRVTSARGDAQSGRAPTVAPRSSSTSRVGNTVPPVMPRPSGAARVTAPRSDSNSLPASTAQPAETGRMALNRTNAPAVRGRAISEPVAPIGASPVVRTDPSAPLTAPLPLAAQPVLPAGRAPLAPPPQTNPLLPNPTGNTVSRRA